MKISNWSALGIALVACLAGAAHAGSLALSGNSCNNHANATYDGTSPGIAGYGGVVICPIELYELSTDIVANVDMMVSEYSTTAALTCYLNVHNSSGGVVARTAQATSAAGTGSATLRWSSVNVQRGGYLYADCAFPGNGTTKPQVRFIKVSY